MRLATTTTGLLEARRGMLAHCPACAEPVIPKCGPIVRWHWAHRVNDCDSWAEPETAWHLDWKRRGFQSEVVMRRNGQCHRADLVTPTNVVVELQAGYLDLASIQARERFYGRMVWLYRADWMNRLHFGAKGFWWKHGSKAMAMSTQPIFWDCDGAIWRVTLGIVTTDTDGQRVLGRIQKTITPASFTAWIQGNCV